MMAIDGNDPTKPGTSGGGFSAPPSAGSDLGKYNQMSFTPPKTSGSKDYDTADFSKFTSSVRESDGLSDDYYRASYQNQAQTAGSQPSMLNNFYNSLPPRARGCLNAIGMGARMGAAVGGCFGFLTGAYASVVHRNVLLLPVGVLGGAASFGFFLGCGMIIRCDERGRIEVVRQGSLRSGTGVRSTYRSGSNGLLHFSRNNAAAAGEQRSLSRSYPFWLGGKRTPHGVPHQRQEVHAVLECDTAVEQVAEALRRRFTSISEPQEATSSQFLVATDQRSLRASIPSPSSALNL
ncbi:unnamed protein product [Amoebophrya sp. A120]|nr:unnamed protein product [Amoebophrya sp. A120]|eukprot:GSA120T00005273001.1